jgi:predicted aspartyl protease
MTWTTPPAFRRKLLWRPLWKTRGVIALLWLLHAVPLFAQSRIYTWTDEYGVTHFSDSVVSPAVMDKAKTLAPSAKSSSRASHSGEDIPLLVFPNRPLQKFVQAEVEGERISRQVLMLVDTGASISMIDESLAKELDIEHVEEVPISGVTGTSKLWIARVPSLRLGEDEIKDVQVAIGHQPGLILLGMDILERLKLSVGPRSLQRHQ